MKRSNKGNVLNNYVSKRKELQEYTDMSYWFPKLQKITGIKLPKTILLNANYRSLMNELLGDESVLPVTEKLVEKIISTSKDIGVPLFLRTGLTSAKHNWENTCYVDNVDRKILIRHLYNIVEFSEIADMIGIGSNTWAVREYLPVKTNLRIGLWGNMPVTKERRYFIDKGKVVHRQAYWDPEAVRQGKPSNILWEDILRDINRQFDDEVKLLTGLSETVGEVFPEYWSIDWLYVGQEWYLTDMARGEISYKYTQK